MNLEFINVCKNYGVVNAIKNISFKINSGDFVLMAGPSGAGKTTILKLILHQIKPSSGNIYVEGHDISKDPKIIIDKIRRQIGVIYQDYQLIPDKTVEENISLALDIIGYPSSKTKTKIEQVINQVNLSSRRHLFPSQLAGGELQRASLARALAVEPKLILADEPTGNLDVENSWNLIKLIKDINEENGTTIIMTTHNQDIIQSLNKRTLFINNGEIVLDTMVNKTNTKPKATHSTQPKKHVSS